jgi:ubiquinone/menaquinone biosynthesis C-methylase UbiE/DNA-binding transcriptional ArsR family regulator
MKASVLQTSFIADDLRLERMLKALASPLRLRIIKILTEKQRCTSAEVGKASALAPSSVGRHLKALREASLITAESDGYGTRYSPNENGLHWLKNQIAERQQAFAVSKAFLGEGMRAASISQSGVDGQGRAQLTLNENRSGYPNGSHCLTESLRLPLANQSLDAVFANLQPQCTPDPQAALREMTRALKGGGRLLVGSLNTQAGEGACFGPGQLCEWLQEAGLVNVFTDCPSENAQPLLSAAAFVTVGTRRIRRKEAVRAVYSLLAEAGSPSRHSRTDPQFVLVSVNNVPVADLKKCCSAATGAKSAYSPAEWEFVPAEAGEISLGCGNPLAFSRLKPGETVLDIGSGGGMDAFLAARQVGQGGHVIGVDLSPAMLTRARCSAETNGYCQVEFHQGEAENLPVEDASVDVVISNCVINLTEDKGLAFRQAYRVLKAGGRLEISDILAAGDLPQSLRQNPPEWAACVAGALPEQEYLDLMRAAGFSDIQVVRSQTSPAGRNAVIYSAAISARKE